MSALVVVAEIEFHPGRGEEGMQRLQEVCERTHAEDAGCELYAVHRVEGDPDRAVCIEKWRSADDLSAHIESDHARALIAFDGIVGPPRVLRLEAAGFGQPELGAL